LVDATEQTPIAGASIVLLKPDSTVVKYTRTRNDGSFKIVSLQSGNFYLLISHAGFTDHWRTIEIEPKEFAELGIITITPRADSLSPVIVTPKAPTIKIRGDTLEYSAGSVKTNVNATVEELLQHLPGFRLDANGSIYFNGRKIDKLLVDGEQIFGKDPKNITRIFTSNLFSKVQIYDKKSDQATYTGIDDGKTTTTLNLVTKKDTRKGVFGQVEAGGGTDSYYENNGLLGAFRNKRQLAAMALVSNTGTNQISGVDDDVAVISANAETDDGLNASAGLGVPHSTVGAIHYSNKWDNRNEHITGNYSYGHTLTYPITTNIIQQTLPDSLYSQRQISASVNASDNHGFSGSYDIDPDTLSSIHIHFRGSSGSSNNNFTSTDETHLNETLVNQGIRNVSSKTTNNALNGNMYWSRRLNKIGGMLSGSLDLGSNHSRSSGFIYSNQYFQYAGIDTIDQKKGTNRSSTTSEATLNYVRPISRVVSIALTYGMSNVTSLNKLETYGKLDGKYADFIDSLSLNFKTSTKKYRQTLNLILKDKKYIFMVGGDIRQEAIYQYNYQQNNEITSKYQFFSPWLYGHFSPSENRLLTFNYSHTNQLPSVSQLQPFTNNIDPLHITIGNSQLKPAGVHTISFRYLSVKKWATDWGLHADIHENDFANLTITDSLGRQNIKPVNIRGNWNFNVNAALNHTFQPANLNLSYNIDAGYVRSNNYANELLCKNDSYQINMHLGLGKSLPNGSLIRLSSELRYAYSNSSANSTITKYITQVHNLLINMQLPVGIEFNSSLSVSFLQKTAFSQSHQIWVWNCYLGKTLMSRKLSVRLRGNDLFGQQSGISRSISANQITETNTNNVVGRYVLLSIIFHLPHNNISE